MVCQIQQKSRTWSGLRTLVLLALRFILLYFPKLTSLECPRIVECYCEGQSWHKDILIQKADHPLWSILSSHVRELLTHNFFKKKQKVGQGNSNIICPIHFILLDTVIDKHWIDKPRLNIILDWNMLWKNMDTQDFFKILLKTLFDAACLVYEPTEPGENPQRYCSHTVSDIQSWKN